MINKEPNLETYFHNTIRDISTEKNVDIKDHTLWYLTNLLTRYSRSDQFFDFRPESGTFTPLAEYYRQAHEAESDHERRLHLQRLGDVAIFVSGLFAPALNKRVVGLNYYISMGESAYGCLADSGGSSARDKALCEIFADLARRFSGFVAILSELNGGSADAKPEAWQQWFEHTLAEQRGFDQTEQSSVAGVEQEHQTILLH
jgi:hypothetical protein